MPDEVRLATRDEWLKARREGIGGSDAAAILGESPFKSPLALYAEKLGLLDVQETEPMRWGSALEPIIAEAYARETGRELRDPGRFTLRRDPASPVLFATLDREILGDPRGPGALEIKSTNAFQAEQWEDGPPLYVQIQHQHQLSVTGYGWGAVAVLIGGQQLRTYDLERNDRFIARLRIIELEFWARLEKLEPPLADASESSREALARLYPKDDGATVELPAEALVWDRRLVRAKAAEKRLKAVIDEYENAIKAAIGEASRGALPGGGAYTWKLQNRVAYTVPPAEFRVLRRTTK